MLARSIQFVSSSAESVTEKNPEHEPQAQPTPKRARLSSSPTARLTSYITTGRYEILVTDPRPVDVVSQSLTFNTTTHEHMQADGIRCGAFADALSLHARGKTVLEIGTGPFVLLALAAARAGATRVYAVEGDPASAAAARRRLSQLTREGDADASRIILIERFSTSLTPADVPEAIDIVVHELLGTFASSEGVRHFYDDLRARLPAAAAALSIPHRAMTMLAPGAPPSIELLSRVADKHTAIGPLQKYLVVGRGSRLPPSLRIAEPQPFEEIAFHQCAGAGGCGNGLALGCGVVAGMGSASGDDEEEVRVLTFVASRDGVYGGCYAHLRFEAAAGGGGLVDAFDSGPPSTSWAVLYLPLAHPRDVLAGETMTVTCTVAGSGSRAPSYAFEFGGEERVALTLAELYPLDGGEWCRSCSGVTASVEEERAGWLRCRGCGDSYHRRCRWDGAMGPVRGWRCAKCATQ